MPFTFSHPAIIIPLLKLNRKYISATALVAGSMAPDFEYFINFQMKQIHGHTFSGMLYYDLPLAIIMCFAFHTLVRDGLIHYSPRFIKNRWCHFIGFDWKSRWQRDWKVIMTSAFIGICSHLFLDSFTHAHRFMTDHLSFLHEEFNIAGQTLPLYKIGQLYGSVVGLFFLAWVILREPVKQEFHSGFRIKIYYWILVGLITFVLLLLRNIEGFEDVIATSIAGCMIGLMIAPKIVKQLKLDEEQEIIY